MKPIKNVSIIAWQHRTHSFMQEPLIELGYECNLCDPKKMLPADTDLFFSFGYHEDLFLFLDKFENLKDSQRPLFIHWNTEGVPDLRFPRWLIEWGSNLRSDISRRAHRPNPNYFVNFLSKRANRFRYLGDYLYAYKHNLMPYMFDSSMLYVALEKSLGLPAHYVPWGTLKRNYSNLNMERDIDVLWMAKPRGRRRNNLVNSIRGQLAKYGKKMVVVDGIEHPYVYEEERTKLLNRSKVTLNLLPAWDAYNYIFKFHLAAGNRSLLVSEPFLEHNPEYIEGFHYVSSPVENLVKTLIFYCENEQERIGITENAYRLVTTSMTMTNSVQRILSLVTR